MDYSLGKGKAEISKPPKEEDSSPSKWLLVPDFITSRIVGVLVVAFWKATWTLIDEHIFPDDVYYTIAVSAVLGPGITLAAMILQGFVMDKTSKMGPVTKQVFFRVYLYVGAISSVNGWRWLWYLTDELTGKTYLSFGVCLGVGAVGLVALRRLVNIMACPGMVILDLHDDVILSWPTFFEKKPGTWQHVGDCLFTVGVVASLVLGCWRGLWGLMDLALFPDDSLKSALYSLLISISLSLLLLAIREPTRILSKMSDRRHKVIHLMVEDTNTILHFAHVVLLWRGFWMLFDDYFLEPPTRFWVCHFVGYLCLVITLACGSTLTRGCTKDGVIPEGQGVVFDIHYVSNMVHAYKSLKTEQSNSDKPKLDIEVVYSTRFDDVVVTERKVTPNEQ